MRRNRRLGRSRVNQSVRTGQPIVFIAVLVFFLAGCVFQAFIA